MPRYGSEINDRLAETRIRNSLTVHTHNDSIIISDREEGKWKYIELINTPQARDVTKTHTDKVSAMQYEIMIQKHFAETHKPIYPTI